MLPYKTFTFYKKLNVKNINFYIILFISFSVFELNFCQKIVRDLNDELNQGNVEEVVPEEQNVIDECRNNPTPDLCKDPYGYYACYFGPYINNKECFNNILIFNQKKYQVNNFATNKNGDILIQYNEYINNYEEKNSSRLFYGLTKNGNNFFSDKSSYIHEFNISIDEDILEDSDFLNFYEIQDSKSLFVSIKNDINRGNQYLFSINSYNSMVELYDLNNDNNNYLAWSFYKFFKLDKDDYFFLFKYELFELKEKCEYIIAFIPLFEVDEVLLDVSFIKKFRLKSFDNDAYEELRSINYEEYLNTSIINIFFLEETKTLVTLSIKENIIENEIIVKDECYPFCDVNRQVLQKSKDGSEWPPYPNYPLYKFNLRFYEQNLNSLLGAKEVILESEELYRYLGEDLLIKSLTLNVLKK